MTAFRIALALAVVGVALAACGDASPSPTATPTPSAVPTATLISVETPTGQKPEQIPGCQGGACLDLVKWPSFEATYEYEGEIKKIRWAALDDWRIETLDANPMTTPYGEFSAAGSWEEQQGLTYRAYDSVTDVISTETYESNEYISPDGITPLLASLYEFPKRVNAPRVRTETEVCYLEKCAKQAEGLRIAERPHLDAIVTDDIWRIPLENNGLKMLKLVIQADRQMPEVR